MIELIRRQSGRDALYRIWHQSDENMLLYIHEGQGSIVTTDAITPFTKGTLCLIGSQVDHYTLPDLTHPYVRSKILFDDITLAQMSALLDVSFSPQDCVIGEVEDPDSVLDWMDRYAMAGGCLMLLSALQKTGVSHPHKGMSTVEQAIVHIHGHISEELDIDSLCAAIHTSKYHFCRQFKAVTGLTVMKYIIKTRVLLAKQRMAQGERNMAQISEACGFSCQSHFSRVFKEETGKTPLQYRRELTGK